MFAPEQVWLETIDIEKYQAMCDLYEFRSMRNRLHTMKESGGATMPAPHVEEEREVISDHDMKELRVMTHLLHSEMTNAPLVDIENITGKKTCVEMKDFLFAELTKEGLVDLYTEVEKPLITRVEEMEVNGITLDTDNLKKMSEISRSGENS